MRKFLLAFLVSVLMVSIIQVVISNNKVSALSGNEFRAGRIIDDKLFYDGDTMSVTQIQNFLNSKVPSCDTNGELYYGSVTRASYSTSRGYPPPFTCLKDYRMDTPFKAGESGLCGAITAKTNQSSAQIIDTIASSCGISEKVILVMLQKEQGLVTDDWPWPIQYTKAMGYYCPDDPNNPGWCHPDYAGFFNQVYNAARQFQRYKADPNNWNHIPFATNNILYQANAPSCGSRSVYIENYATAGLYNYTPYTPNQAALNNLYGTGDGCSAYGNRNFWRYYNDWFGSPIVAYNIVPVYYDINTDTTGDTAMVGFKLTSKPDRNVEFNIYYSQSNFSSAETKIKITPSNWDRPQNNLVILKGRYNPYLNGNQTLYLYTDSLVSDDRRFNLSSNYTPDIPILHQDTSNSIYRLFDEVNTSHLFTGSATERAQLINEGWRDEGIAFYSCTAGNVVYARLSKDNDYKIAQFNSATYQRLIKEQGYEFNSLIASGSYSGKHILYYKYSEGSNASLYTTNSTEGDGAGYVSEGTLPICPQNTLPVYRLYSSEGKNHFYTQSPHERNLAREKMKYRYEGVGFYLGPGRDTPIYRLYSSEGKNHFYTQSEYEKDKAVEGGYRYEGIGYYSSSSDVNPVYRLYSSEGKNHFYTQSEYEKDRAVEGGYRYEGIGYYSY